MQTLGLSESTPRTESRWRALLWPTIRNQWDLDYVTRQGFWVCFVLATMTLVVNMAAGFVFDGLFEAGFYYLAAMGVRERSRSAGIAAFTAYLLSGFVMYRFGQNGFSILRIVFLALLLANVRGNLQAAGWKGDADEGTPERLNDTFGDKLADQMPRVVWPKGKYLFFVLAPAEIALLAGALIRS